MSFSNEIRDELCRVQRRRSCCDTAEAYGILAKRAFELGGSPSAEHGIGKLKRDYIGMVYGEEGISQIRRVKSAFDPNNILNRGNIVE